MRENMERDDYLYGVPPDERVAPLVMDDAARRHRRAMAIEADRVAMVEVFDAEIRRLTERRDAESERLAKYRDEFLQQVEQWFRAARRSGATKATSLEFPSGRVSLPQRRATVDVTDEEALRAWADENGRTETLWPEPAVPAAKLRKTSVTDFADVVEPERKEPGSPARFVDTETGQLVPGIQRSYHGREFRWEAGQ